LTTERLDWLLDEFVDCGVFHIVLSGGEPMAKFDLLEYGVKQATSKGISVSVNSTLSLATPKRIQRLRKAGLEHILASWYDLDPVKTNEITATKNAHQKVIDGIKCAVENGIRVSVNTIVTNNNKDSIYIGNDFNDIVALKIMKYLWEPANSHPRIIKRSITYFK
jgi:molybdenum cofactor biosynthesis enzyme MoaA